MMERLDKFLAAQGKGTRKEVGRLIRSGAVAVDGVPVRDPAAKVDPSRQTVAVGGNPILWQEHLYIMMNKPAGVLSATEDRRQKTVLDLLPEDLRRRAGYLISAAAELAAGMEHGEYNSDGRKPGRLLDPHRDTAAVIRHRNDIARQNTDIDLIAEARKGLVDRVVYNLIDKMMQAPFAGGAYVHARTLAHRLQALENLYLITAVILGCLSNFAEIQ